MTIIINQNSIPLSRCQIFFGIYFSSYHLFFTKVFGDGRSRAGVPNWSLGFVDLQRGIALIIGTFLLARVGAYVSFKTPPYRLRIMFALFIISLSIYMLVK